MPTNKRMNERVGLKIRQMIVVGGDGGGFGRGSKTP